MAARLRLWVACGFLLSLGACVESEQPIAKIATAKQDPRLYGLWTSRDGGRLVYILIGDEPKDPLEPGRPEVEPGLMRYWSMTQEEENHKIDEPSGAQFYCTQVGDHRFANWITPAEKGQPPKPPTFFFLKYHVDENALTIWLQDPKKTAEAIESGKLQGEVKRKDKRDFKDPGGVDSVRITGTSENIHAFLANGGATSCFPDENKVVYQRGR